MLGGEHMKIHVKMHPPRLFHHQFQKLLSLVGQGETHLMWTQNNVSVESFAVMNHSRAYKNW